MFTDDNMSFLLTPKPNKNVPLIDNLEYGDFFMHCI